MVFIVDQEYQAKYNRFLRWTRWTTGALLLPIIAMTIMAAAQGQQLQLVSTAWAPFTNPPGQPRFALDLVGEALERVGIIAETVIVDEDRLTPRAASSTEARPSGRTRSANAR